MKMPKYYISSRGARIQPNSVLAVRYVDSQFKIFIMISNEYKNTDISISDLADLNKEIKFDNEQDFVEYVTPIINDKQIAFVTLRMFDNFEELIRIYEATKHCCISHLQLHEVPSKTELTVKQLAKKFINNG